MRKSNVITKVRIFREAAPKQSQQILADALGVSRQTIIAIESGRYAPSLDLALRIAKYFKQPVETIFTLKDDE